MPGPGFEKSKYRQQNLERFYGSLRGTIFALRREVASYLADAPEKHKPEFSWYFQNLDDAWEAMNRVKPDFSHQKPHRDERDLRRTLAQELELDEK